MTLRPALSLSLLCAVVSFANAETIFFDLNNDGDNTNDSIPLSELENGGVIEFEGKMFSGFGYSSTGDNPDSDGVNVIPIIDCGGNLGLRFQGGFLDLPGGNSSDALITFGVSIEATSGSSISEIHLAANPSVFGPPASGLVSITETFVPNFRNMRPLTVFNNGQIVQLTDWIVLNPDEYVTTLQVQKDILLFAGESAAGAGLSFVDQTFSMVPEPTGLMLFALAVAGLAMRRRG